MAIYNIHDSRISQIFDSYPDGIRNSLLELRQIIFRIGNSLEDIGSVQESVKWGQPSYTTIQGTSVRLGWSKKDPNRFALLFSCTTKLVSTFRSLFGSTLQFEGNRAILFRAGEKVPNAKVELCIEIALTYHKRKNLPLLGAEKGTLGWRDTKI